VSAWNFDPTYLDVAAVNMYGCTPCPRCRMPYRCTFKKEPDVVVCDDCGFREPRVDKPEQSGPVSVTEASASGSEKP
jgi:hypothetical protein